MGCPLTLKLPKAVDILDCWADQPVDLILKLSPPQPEVGLLGVVGSKPRLFNVGTAAESSIGLLKKLARGIRI